MTNVTTDPMARDAAARTSVADDRDALRIGFIGLCPDFRVAVAALVLVCISACGPAVSPTPSPLSSARPSASATSAPSVPPPSPTPPSASASASPSASPDPPLSLPVPEVSDPRVVTASVAANIGAESGTLTVVVTSVAAERVDDLVLRWPTELGATLSLAPFIPSDNRIREGGPPLVQAWTKWVVGPGERGEPAGTISLGYGPLLPGAELTIELAARRVAPGPVAFDLQILAANDLLTLDGGAPAKLRVEVP